MLASIVGAVAAVVVTVIVMNFTTSESEIERSLEHRYGVGDPQFRRELGILLGPPIIDGNRVQSLQNGDEIFPAMLEAIRGAQRRRSRSRPTSTGPAKSAGNSPTRCPRSARDGVKVHVLIDWVGSQKMDAALLEEMRDAGRRGAPLSPAALVQPRRA